MGVKKRGDAFAVGDLLFFSVDGDLWLREELGDGGAFSVDVLGEGEVCDVGASFVLGRSCLCDLD